MNINRYPFTAYPKGWYMIGKVQNKSFYKTIFGKQLFIPAGLSNLCYLDGYKFPLISKQGFYYLSYGSEEIFSANEIPLIEEFESKYWIKPFHLNFQGRVHIQEVAENAVDLAHFSRVHEYTDEPVMEYLHFDRYKFEIQMSAPRTTLGIKDHPKMKITYFGPGIVHAHIDSKNVNLKVLLTNTPINEEQLEINHYITIKKRNLMMNMIHRIFLPPVIKKDFNHDFPIWENKIYRSKPILTSVEKPICQIRHWYKQFYI